MSGKESPRRKSVSKLSSRKEKVSICVENCKYAVVPAAAKILGWKAVDTKFDWDILWGDTGFNVGKFYKLARKYQKINHFPGMVQIYRKGHLARAISKMQHCSEGYDFFPLTWVLPTDYADICAFFKNTPQKDRIVIVKPCSGSQGKGIYLALNSRQIHQYQDCVVQTYISRPLLIDSKKFDLRIYALVVSCDPLRIYIYRDGLVRLCVVNYHKPTASNIENQYMHLTNYAVNKHSDDYQESNDNNDESTSSKRSVSWLMDWLVAQTGDTTTPDRVWRDISDVIVKTLISVQPSLAESYRSSRTDADERSPFTCFELLGFDILLDESLRAHLLEVNHSPSFRTDTDLDARIKLGLVEDTLRLLNVSGEDKTRYYARNAAQSQIRLYGQTLSGEKSLPKDDDTAAWIKYLRHERDHMGKYQLIYPSDYYPNQPTRGKERYYEHLHAIAGQLYKAGVGERALTGVVDDKASARAFASMIKDEEKKGSAPTTSRRGSSTGFSSATTADTAYAQAQRRVSIEREQQERKLKIVSSHGLKDATATAKKHGSTVVSKPEKNYDPLSEAAIAAFSSRQIDAIDMTNVFGGRFSPTHSDHGGVVDSDHYDEGEEYEYSSPRSSEGLGGDMLATANAIAAAIGNKKVSKPISSRGFDFTHMQFVDQPSDIPILAPTRRIISLDELDASPTSSQCDLAVDVEAVFQTPAPPPAATTATLPRTKTKESKVINVNIPIVAESAPENEYRNGESATKGSEKTTTAFVPKAPNSPQRSQKSRSFAMKKPNPASEFSWQQWQTRRWKGATDAVNPASMPNGTGHEEFDSNTHGIDDINANTNAVAETDIELLMARRVALPRWTLAHSDSTTESSIDELRARYEEYKSKYHQYYTETVGNMTSDSRSDRAK